jgi:hypothetical protein
MLLGVRCELDRVQLRHQALNYAWHGWDVLPGAYLAGDRFSCGPGCHTVACHPATMDGTGSASHESGVIEAWWSFRPYSVLLATGLAFDVLEIPGSADADRMVPTGPAAMTPAGRLMLLVRPGGTLRPELAARYDTVLHAARSWIPAPSTRTPDGPVRWLVPPVTVGWRLPDPRPIQARLVTLLLGRSPRN